jgi:hypothetical protein
MVNLTQCVLKYALSVVEIRRAAAVGGAVAPPWEEKPIYGFYIELSTGASERLERRTVLTYTSFRRAHHLSILFYSHVHLSLNPDLRYP